ncbi:MAG TPA: recombination regulator RecX [Burkholderiales bacterium]|jgi:regulatory protein|nr:recombination regulator RecX [Burkholderiales bacterium]
MEKPDTPAELKARALRLLARREHSRAELARKLAPRAESAEVIEAVLRQLIEKKQLSDERYAEARAHWLSRKYGAARIRQDLKAHGVAAPVADRVSSAGDLEKARTILARKYRTPATTREEKARRARFLQARGFSPDVVQALVVRAED